MTGKPITEKPITEKPKRPPLPTHALRPLGRIRRETLAAWTARTQQALITVDCSGCADKRDVLSAIARALELPSWFGLNWDALYDALTDLPQQRPAAGYVLLLEHLPDGPRFGTDERAALLAVLRDTVDDYAERKIPFRVLYD